MDIKIEKRENDIIVLGIEENLIGSNSNDLNDKLEFYIDTDELNIVINMKSVSQIDSYALGVLATSGNTIKENGGNLKFCELQPFVQTIFNMMRMNDIFEIYDSIDEAVSSF